MSLYECIGTNKKHESEGVWVNHPDYPQFRLKLARAGGSNVKFNLALKKYCSDLNLEDITDIIGDNKKLDLFAKVLADSIVMDWEGAEDKEGKALEFSKKNVQMMLTDPILNPQLIVFVINSSVMVDSYKWKKEEAEKKP